MLSEEEIIKKVLDSYNFNKLNPVQELALKKGLLGNKSIVVSTPTASGKTLCAALIALNTFLSGRKKTLYLCPLVALAQEHYSNFKEKFSKFGIKVALSIGDIDSSDNWLRDYDLIICSNEKADSLIRHGADWIKDIGLIIVDEIHLLNDVSRGPTLEILLTRLREMNSAAKIVCLSATINNVEELSSWLEAVSVTSNWRPVKLYEGISYNSSIKFLERDGYKLNENLEQDLSVIENTLEMKKQLLAFVSTRRSTEAFAEKLIRLTRLFLTKEENLQLEKISEQVLNILETPTKQCRRLSNCIKNGVAFHHAGLLSKQKRIIEDEFRKGIIKVITATPTLAMGINLPAFRVMIKDAKRYYSGYGSQYIPVMEYKQMCLPFNAKILTKEFGDIEIGKIVEKKPKCSVLSLNVKKLKFEFKPITEYYSRKVNELVEITTNTGGKLRITDNHPVLIFNNKKFYWKKAAELSVGDFPVHSKTITKYFQRPPYMIDLLPNRGVFVGNFGKYIKITENKLKITEKYLVKLLNLSYKRMYHLKNNKKSMPLYEALRILDMLNISKERKALIIKKVKSKYGNWNKFPPIVDKDLLWLAGFIATDGNLNRTVDKRTGSTYINLRIFNKNRLLIKKAKRILKNLGFKPHQSEKENGLVTLETGATLFSQILSKHFGIPLNYKRTKVTAPKFLFNLDPNLIGAYLGGVFDGDGNFNIAKQKYDSNVYRILFTTTSKKFAYDIRKLLFKLGIVPTIINTRKKTKSILQGKQTVFSKPVYYVIFRKIDEIKTFSKYSTVTKCKINVNYSTYRKNSIKNLNYSLRKVVRKRKILTNETVYNIRVKDNENYIVDGIVVHNCGRAGRPDYNDKFGESILVAKSESESEEFIDRYIQAEPEEIQSKLALEPVLRMHTLALIASNFVNSEKSLLNFFGKTFFSHQYGSLSEIEKKLERIISMLKEFQFLVEDGEKLYATILGKRISELYLDPITGHHFVQAVTKAAKGNPTIFSYLQMFSQTAEMRPLLSVRNKDIEEIEQILVENDGKFLTEIPEEWDMDYEDFMKSVKTALVFYDWINELTDDHILTKHNMAPGELRTRLTNADWLLYSAYEIALLLSHKELLNPLNKIRVRMKHGIKEELISLVRLRNVGRIRARKLFTAGFRSIEDLRKTTTVSLEKVVGPTIAQQIKKQLGEKEEKQTSLL